MERDEASSYFLCLHGWEIVVQGRLAVEEGRLETVPLCPRQDCTGRLLAWMPLCRALDVGRSGNLPHFPPPLRIPGRDSNGEYIFKYFTKHNSTDHFLVSWTLPLDETSFPDLSSIQSFTY